MSRQRQPIVLDWSRAKCGPKAVCVICRRRGTPPFYVELTILRDPADGRPKHKTCAERVLSGNVGAHSAVRRQGERRPA